MRRRDAALLAAISRGEFTLNGFRNRDLRHLLFARPGRTKAEQKRQAAAVSRKLAPAARPPPDPQGAAYAPLSSDPRGTHHRHRADHRPQCQHYRN